MKTKKESYDNIVRVLEVLTTLEVSGVEVFPMSDALKLTTFAKIKEDVGNLLNAKVMYINSPHFAINREDGSVVEQYQLGNDPTSKYTEDELSHTKSCYTGTYRMGDPSKEVNEWSTPGHIFYLYDISIAGNGDLHIRGDRVNFHKKAVTFTLSEDIYKEFSIKADEMAINKSKFVENKLKEFLTKQS